MRSRYQTAWRSLILFAALAGLLLLPGPFTLATETREESENQSEGKVDEHAPPDDPSKIFSTLEDIYGEAGDTFQAAVGMINYEKEEATDPDPAPGFGYSIDDMVIEWREFYLDADNATCSSAGECAVIDTQTGSFFEGNTRLEITVLEKSPPWTHGSTNDCDDDGDTDGVEDGNDCDSNGTNDLVIKATSEVEVSGEIVFANNVGGHLYKAELPVSALYDAEGVLFVRPFGADNPTVCAVYWDMDDGTGQVCKNDPDPAAQGRLEICSTLYFTTGTMTVITAILNDNKDADGWADSNETVDMELLLSNKTGIDLSGLSARLVTNDPKIECIVNPVMDLGSWAADLTDYTGSTFTFKVADVDRTALALGPTDAFSAEFSIILSANEFDAASIPQTVTLNLDLDGAGGGGPGAYQETFENGNFGSFTTMNMDSGRNSETASEGWRCSYSDPDWQYSNPYGAIDDCWLAATPTQAAAYFWQIDSTVAGENNRAYDDAHSLYMGIYDSGNGWWTSPMATLEAVGSLEPINLGFANVCEDTRTVPCDSDTDCPGEETCTGVFSELTFKHQISHVDWRSVGPMYYYGAVDHSMVALQTADTDTDGTPVGVWNRLEPYYNVYDTSAYDWFVNCNFDPTDDGNTEDDFDDPDDPFRRLGPSSSCFPLYNYSYCGDTDADYAPGNVNRCSEPDSGLQGLTGTGTWVESKVNLSQWRGGRVRIRFMSTALKNEGFENWEAQFAWNADTGGWGGDDGWWIDDVQISDTLASFAVITNDDKDNSALPGCGNTCGTVTPVLTADPPGTLGAPGQVVELDAIASSATRCVDGTLQYQFWVDGDGDSDGGGVLDTLLRGWTDNPVIIHAPDETTTYVVDVRCSSLIGSYCLADEDVACESTDDCGGLTPTDCEPACEASKALEKEVICPWSGLLNKPAFPATILAYTGVCQADTPHKAWCAGPNAMHPCTTRLEWAGLKETSPRQCCNQTSDCSSGTCVLADNDVDTDGKHEDAYFCYVENRDDAYPPSPNPVFVPVSTKVYRYYNDHLTDPPPWGDKYTATLKVRDKMGQSGAPPALNIGFLDEDETSSRHGWSYLVNDHGPRCNAIGTLQNSTGSEPHRDDDLP